MKKFILLSLLSVAPIMSAIAESKVVSVKPDTGLLIIDAFSSLCGSSDIEFKPKQSPARDGKAQLAALTLSSGKALDEVGEFVSLLASRVSASCSNEIKVMSSRPTATSCEYARKRIFVAFDSSLRDGNSWTYFLKDGKFILNTSDEVTVKITEVKKN